MADQKISELDEETTLGANDLFAIVDEGADPDQTKRILWSNILKYAISQALLTTRGDIPFRGAAVAERLAKGTEKQALVQGANDPAWGWRLIAPTNGTGWENRTYEGWEIVDTATEYTIGSGKDFATLAAAATSLKKLILSASITLKLEEAITLTDTVTFSGMISCGGSLLLDLNNYDITINHDGDGIVADGQFSFCPRDPTYEKSIIAGANAGASTYLVRYYRQASGNLYKINLDANSKAIAAMLRVSNDSHCYVIADADFVDTGGGDNYTSAVKCEYNGFVGSTEQLGVAGDELTVASGGIVIDSAGHIYTSAGEYTP